MAFERVMGLDVSDDENYSRYRENMLPILASYGGSFGYDFKIAELLRSKNDAKINRVFTIAFPDEATMHAFFADESYLEVKAKYFDSAVASATVIALHEIAS